MRKFLLIISLVISGLLLAIAQEYSSQGRMSLTDLIAKSEQGDMTSIYNLARLYETGYDTISRDSTKSIQLYLLAAGLGYPPAMNYVGYRYFTGQQLNQNVDSAFYWIRKAASKGDITAAANLGYLLSENSDSINNEEAAKWLSIAAEAGVSETQFKLIELKETEWRNLSSDSALNLGRKYFLGKAPLVGVELLKIAALSDNPKALALLGYAYSMGAGVEYNHEKSTEYFLRGAEGGDPSSQFILAELLEFFPDLYPDTDPSYWYEKAAAQGVTDAESAYKVLLENPNKSLQ